MQLTLTPAVAADSGSAGYDPCIDDEVEAYLNRGDVQAALHANDSAHALPYPWSDCNHRIHYNWCAIEFLLFRKNRVTDILPGFFAAKS